MNIRSFHRKVLVVTTCVRTRNAMVYRINFFFFFNSGEYRVGVKFNDQHIPDSPFRVYITPAQGDAHKIEIGQFPEAGCQVNKPQAFIVRKNGAKGDFDSKVIHFLISKWIPWLYDVKNDVRI